MDGKKIFRLSRVVVRVLEVQEVQVVRWTVGYITEECGAPSPPPAARLAELAGGEAAPGLLNSHTFHELFHKN